MKKSLALFGALLLTGHAFADSITDGIGTAGDAIYSYTPYVQALGYVLAGIIGIIASFVIYYVIANNERDVKKRILTWGGACVTMLSMTIAYLISLTIRSLVFLQEMVARQVGLMESLQEVTNGER